MCKVAAVYGQLEVLQWARAHGCPCDEKTCAYAARNGHLAVLQWARANGCPWDEGTYAMAAPKKRRFDVLQWVQPDGYPWVPAMTDMSDSDSSDGESDISDF